MGALREEDKDQGPHVGVQFEFALLLSEACYTTRGEGERKSQHYRCFIFDVACS